MGTTSALRGHTRSTGEGDNMPLNRHILIRLFALALIVGAVIAPTASARPISSGQGTVGPPTPTLESTTSAKSDGFNWADAGIGAGIVVAVVAAGFTVRLTTRRPAQPSTASRPTVSVT
jgi:hypothetical protein